MVNLDEQIATIQKEIRETPYHKATEHHIGRLKAKLARLKDLKIEISAKRSTRGVGYAIKKQGDATVVLVGPPSVGKSTLLNKFTNAQSKVAPYDFTTIKVVPGMMIYKDARIQILDVPGIIEGAEKGRGRGREVLSVARGADLLVIMSDIKNTNKLSEIVDSLEKNGIRINQKKPDVRIDKKISGGIIVKSNIKQDFNKETIKEIAIQMGTKNAEISINEKLTMEKLIDAFSPNRVYIPAIFVVNKIDLSENKSKVENEYCYISAKKGIGIDNLRETIWKKLNLVRIYLVRKDEKPSCQNPLIVEKDTNLERVAQKIGTDFAQGKKKAQIWGSFAKFPGQEVSLNTKVVEEMMVRFI